VTKRRSDEARWLARRDLKWERIKSTRYHELVDDTYVHASVMPADRGWYANVGPDQIYRTVAEAKHAVEKALGVKVKK
jgi:hypothetical protein